MIQRDCGSGQLGLKSQHLNITETESFLYNGCWLAEAVKVAIINKWPAVRQQLSLVICEEFPVWFWL